MSKLEAVPKLKAIKDMVPSTNQEIFKIFWTFSQGGKIEIYETAA